jgi:hypothetical protein
MHVRRCGVAMSVASKAMEPSGSWGADGSGQGQLTQGYDDTAPRLESGSCSAGAERSRSCARTANRCEASKWKACFPTGHLSRSRDSPPRCERPSGAGAVVAILISAVGEPIRRNPDQSERVEPCRCARPLASAGSPSARLQRRSWSSSSSRSRPSDSAAMRVRIGRPRPARWARVASSSR